MRQALHPSVGSLVSGAEKSNLLVVIRRRGAALLARIRARQAATATRLALAELSATQRADIGADAVSAARRGPIIAVDAAIMRRLMAMR